MIHLLTSAMIWGRTLDAATSLLLVAIGGYLCIRAGVFNIGLEGAMIFGCFFAVACSYWATNWGAGVLGAAVTGTVVTGVPALASIYLRADVLLVGLAMNLLGLGCTSLLLQWVFHIRGGFTSQRVRPLPHLRLPLLDAVPWLGTVLSGRGQGGRGQGGPGLDGRGKDARRAITLAVTRYSSVDVEACLGRSLIFEPAASGVRESLRAGLRKGDAS